MKMTDAELERLIDKARADFVKMPCEPTQSALVRLVKLRSPEQVAKMEVERGLKNG